MDNEVQKKMELECVDTKDRIEEFIKSNYNGDDEVYPSDIADSLNLEYNLVLKIFELLKKEGKLGGLQPRNSPRPNQAFFSSQIIELKY